MIWTWFIARSGGVPQDIATVDDSGKSPPEIAQMLADGDAAAIAKAKADATILVAWRSSETSSKVVWSAADLPAPSQSPEGTNGGIVMAVVAVAAVVAYLALGR